jgi:hypothetical protein
MRTAAQAGLEPGAALPVTGARAAPVKLLKVVSDQAL